MFLECILQAWYFVNLHEIYHPFERLHALHSKVPSSTGVLTTESRGTSPAFQSNASIPLSRTNPLATRFFFSAGEWWNFHEGLEPNVVKSQPITHVMTKDHFPHNGQKHMLFCFVTSCDMKRCTLHSTNKPLQIPHFPIEWIKQTFSNWENAFLVFCFGWFAVNFHLLESDNPNKISHPSEPYRNQGSYCWWFRNPAITTCGVSNPLNKSWEI